MNLIDSPPTPYPYSSPNPLRTSGSDVSEEKADPNLNPNPNFNRAPAPATPQGIDIEPLSLPAELDPTSELGKQLFAAVAAFRSTMMRHLQALVNTAVESAWEEKRQDHARRHAPPVFSNSMPMTLQPPEAKGVGLKAVQSMYLKVCRSLSKRHVFMFNFGMPVKG